MRRGTGRAYVHEIFYLRSVAVPAKRGAWCAGRYSAVYGVPAERAELHGRLPLSLAGSRVCLTHTDSQSNLMWVL